MPLAGLVLLAAAFAGGCDVAHSRVAANQEARDEWSRSYPLEAGGEVQIVNANGNIDVQTGPDGTVSVVAERIVKAPTEQTARDVAPRVAIREDVTPSKIILTTEGLSGVVIGVTSQVNYRLTVPAAAAARVRTVNGNITGAGVGGHFVATTTNGTIKASNLRGGVDARTINGSLSLDVAAVGAEPIDVRVTNGNAELALPADAKANLLASVTNGKIDTSGLTLELMGEQSPRRLRGRMNGGGAPVEVNAVNGGVRIRPHQ